MSKLPRLSIVVPVFEQWQLIDGLLACLERQDYPGDRREVLLVADGLAPPRDFPPGVRVLQSTGKGSYAARNSGAAAARGDWLVFTDADCLPRADWLSELAGEMVKSEGNTILAGAVVVVPRSGGEPNAWEIYDMVKGIPQDRYVQRGYGATANLAVPAPLFAALDGFDGLRLSGGDAAFCRRAAAERGTAIRFVAAAVVEHPARQDWPMLVTKARRLKGGHLTAGSRGRRLLWLLRGLAPPVRAWSRFLGARQFPMRHRLLASAIQVRLWGVEMVETVRLLAGAPPERR